MTADSLNLATARSLDQWRNLVSDSFVPLDVPDTSLPNFRGSIASRTFDDFLLCDIAASRHTVERTPRLIGDGGRHYFKLSLILSGAGLLIQDGREAVLLPGDLAVYDTNRPYTLSFDNDFRSMVLMFPHELFKLPAEAVAQLTAVRMPGDQRLGSVVSPFLAQMSKNLAHLLGSSGRRLSHNALDLITTMYSNELDLRTPETSPQQQLLLRIHTYIDDHLGDHDLGPQTIAAEHFISTRHLHNLFRSSESTVGSWIRSRRLEHCRRDLADPICADRPVAAIANRWGFSDAAHFARAFKSAFGISPREYRRQHA